MAQSPGDLPSRQQLELFVQSGQGATELELDMVKKSEKKASKKGSAAPAAKSKKKGKAVADETNSGGADASWADVIVAAEPAAEEGGGGKGRGKGKGKSGGGGGGGGGGATPGMQDTSLEAEARRRYLNYALSVITSRALPDVRDGLKPVQRRILYSMLHDNHLRPDAKHRKSAKVIGAVLGRYHPHGDTSVYDAMVRMAQDWAMRATMID